MASQIDGSATTLTRNKALLDWVRDCAALCQPDRIVWCDGSEDEKERLTEHAVEHRHPHPAQPGEAPRLLPAPLATRTTSRASSTSRSSARRRRTRPGPTNNWMAPDEAYAQARQALRRLDEGPHDVRRPVRHGPARLAARRRSASSSPTASTSSLNMRIMTRMGKVALDMLGDSNDFNRGLHSHAAISTPSAASSATSRRTTRSGAVGSGYGGNVLLGKKCLALRIGSYLGKQRGLARRAHAHPRRREPRGRDDLRRRRRSRARAARPTSR